jgi:hypothetical protein
VEGEELPVADISSVQVSVAEVEGTTDVEVTGVKLDALTLEVDPPAAVELLQGMEAVVVNAALELGDT